MSSAVDIQIVSHPNLEKIENFFKDVSYRETIEFSANFNTRLCIERRLRLPFLDPQTGVAQNHSQLFMDKRNRMPGFRQGQIYTYPAARWRKSRRQYLNKMYRFSDRPFQALRKEHEALIAGNSATVAAGTSSPIVGSSGLLNDSDFSGTLHEESSLGAGGGDTSDSKDSQQPLQNTQQQQTQHQTQKEHKELAQQQQDQPHQLQNQQQPPKEELPKEWYYDDLDMNDVDSLEEPKSPADDEYDYDPRYGTKKRRKRRPGKRATVLPGEGSGRRRSGAGRGRTLDTSNSMDGMDGGGGLGEIFTTPTGRRPRGTGTRGRRRTKATNSANTGDPPSPAMISEPPSFESAAAAVGVVSGDIPVVGEEHGDLRNYRKYL